MTDLDPSKRAPRPGPDRLSEMERCNHDMVYGDGAAKVAIAARRRSSLQRIKVKEALLEQAHLHWEHEQEATDNLMMMLGVRCEEIGPWSVSRASHSYESFSVFCIGCFHRQISA